MKQSHRWVAGVVVLLCAALVVMRAARQPADEAGAMKVQKFAKLPVVFQGRIKPYDTLARNSLTIISEKESFVDNAGRRRPAIDWLLDVISHAEAARHHKVFRIVNDQLLAELGLEPRLEPRHWKFRYSLDEFVGRIGVIEQQANRAMAKPESQRDAYDQNVTRLAEHLHLYMRLSEPYAIPNMRAEREQLAMMVQRYMQIERMGVPHAIPPLKGDHQDEWRPFLRALLESAGSPDPATEAMVGVLIGRNTGDTGRFNDAVAKLETALHEHSPVSPTKIGFEAFFNHLSPFSIGWWFYMFAGVLCITAMLLGWPALQRAAFAVIAFTVVIHTLGIIIRIYLSGYPPVTNLYSSAVFIGWGCVVLGIILELIYWLGIGNLIGAVAGFLTLHVAYYLGLGGDTMEMMQAVLDTQFWLSTHVVTITLGYTATFVAGLIGIVYIFKGLFTRTLTPEMGKTLGRMNYGVLCFALLLSFVGTVLGGLWADDSWGRFWGWDPKENGALIIVLWNALILHARWGGMAGVRGVAVLSVFGNIVTAWSWFGVNMLGVGLHSYGFMNSAVFWLLLFCASQMAIIVLGCLPKGMWMSFRESRGEQPRAVPGNVATA